MDYKVIWDDAAIAELGESIRYIAGIIRLQPEKRGETILKKVGLLGSFPRLGKIFLRLNRDDVREFPVPPYRLIYHIKDAELSVRIMNVWHGVRQEPDLK